MPISNWIKLIRWQCIADSTNDLCMFDAFECTRVSLNRDLGRPAALLIAQIDSSVVLIVPFGVCLFGNARAHAGAGE